MAEQSPQAGFAPVNGANLYYEIAGVGHPLVLLHAGEVDCRMWDDQFSVFAEPYRAIRYDVRGAGRSDMPAVASYSHSEDLYGLLRFLGIEQAFLVGLSLGGRIAIDVALEHPDMVTALVLASPGLSGYKFAQLPEDAGLEAALASGDLTRAAEIITRVWTDGPYRRPDQVDQRVRERAKAMTLEHLSHAQQQPRPRVREAEPPAISRLGKISVPALIVVGDLDHLDILVIADLLQKHLPKAETVTIPGAAHKVNMEDPALFNRFVLKFLGKQ